MARFVPALLRNLNALNWRQALTPVGYQRVQLRILLLTMVISMLMLPGIIAYSLYLHSTPGTLTAVALLGVMGVFGLLILGLTVWMLLIMLKTNLMRWRHLGLAGPALAGMLLLPLVLMGLETAATEIAANPTWLLTGTVPYAVYQWLPSVIVLQLVQALFTYWLYFEDLPFGTHTAPVQTPYATAPGNFESSLLVLQQIWIWFSILAVPMYFAVNAYLSN